MCPWGLQLGLLILHSSCHLMDGVLIFPNIVGFELQIGRFKVWNCIVLLGKTKCFGKKDNSNSYITKPFKCVIYIDIAPTSEGALVRLFGTICKVWLVISGYRAFIGIILLKLTLTVLVSMSLKSLIEMTRDFMTCFWLFHIVATALFYLRLRQQPFALSDVLHLTWNSLVRVWF